MRFLRDRLLSSDLWCFPSSRILLAYRIKSSPQFDMFLEFLRDRACSENSKLSSHRISWLGKVSVSLLAKWQNRIFNSSLVPRVVAAIFVNCTDYGLRLIIQYLMARCIRHPRAFYDLYFRLLIFFPFFFVIRLSSIIYDGLAHLAGLLSFLSHDMTFRSESFSSLIRFSRRKALNRKYALQTIHLLCFRTVEATPWQRRPERARNKRC